MSSVHVPALSADGAITYPRRSLSIPQHERRRHLRFPLNAQAEYILTGHRAHARVVDLGGGGVLLKTDRTLRAGELIQVFIDWPVPLDQRCPLRLVIFGNVLRSDMAGTAVGIKRYEFRIRAQKGVGRSA